LDAVSEIFTGLIVSVANVAPSISTFPFLHWYVRLEPDAVTEKLIESPRHAV